MLVHCLWRWPSINPTMAQHLLCYGVILTLYRFIVSYQSPGTYQSNLTVAGLEGSLEVTPPPPRVDAPLSYLFESHVSTPDLPPSYTSVEIIWKYGLVININPWSIELIFLHRKYRLIYGKQLSRSDEMIYTFCRASDTTKWFTMDIELWCRLWETTPSVHKGP